MTKIGKPKMITSTPNKQGRMKRLEILQGLEKLGSEEFDSTLINLKSSPKKVPFIKNEELIINDSLLTRPSNKEYIDIQDSPITNCANQFNLPVNMSFKNWMQKGLEYDQLISGVTDNIVVNRYILIVRFKFINDLINKYCLQLNEHNLKLSEKFNQLKETSDELIHKLSSF